MFTSMVRHVYQTDKDLLKQTCKKTDDAYKVKEILSEKPKLLNESLNKDGEPALIVASRYNHLRITKQLLSYKGIDVNRKDNGGFTALYQASHNCHIDIVKELLKHPNIDVNIQTNEYGWTALYDASHEGLTDIVKQLVQHPTIDINIQSNIGRTALHGASYNRVDNVKHLLQHQNIDVNIQDNSGYTALYTASEHGHINTVKQLLQHPNIDINIQDKKGKTASDVCCDGYRVDKSKKPLILELFENHRREDVSPASITTTETNKSEANTTPPAAAVISLSTVTSSEGSIVSPPLSTLTLKESEAKASLKSIVPLSPVNANEGSYPNKSSNTSPSSEQMKMIEQIQQRDNLMEEIFSQSAVNVETVRMFFKTHPDTLAYLTRYGMKGEEAEQEVAYIRGKGVLLDYYHMYHRSVTGVVLASQCIASSFIADGRESSMEHISSVISTLLESTSLPGAGMVAWLQETIVTKMADRERNKTIDRLGKTFPVLSSSLACIDILARQITLLQEEEIEAEAAKDQQSGSCKGKGGGLGWGETMKRAKETAEKLMTGVSHKSHERLAESQAQQLLEKVMSSDPAEAIDGMTSLDKLLSWSLGGGTDVVREMKQKREDKVKNKNYQKSATKVATVVVGGSSATSSIDTKPAPIAQREDADQNGKKESKEVDVNDLMQKIDRLEAELKSLKASSKNTSPPPDNDETIDMSAGGGKVFQQKQATTAKGKMKGEEGGKVMEVQMEHLQINVHQLNEHAEATSSKMEDMMQLIEALRIELLENKKR